jgi:dihydropteroate synthase
MGIHIVNDISGGTLDPRMMEVVGRYPTPYIIMHIQGTPQTMQESPTYTDIVVEVRDYLIHQVNTARNAGIKDIIIDLGFGFGKTISHNYTLFEHLPYFAQMGLPVLVGISRKSMIYKLLDISPLETLPYTTALHLQALYYGAKILRVHEIKEAVHTVRLFEQLQST